MTAALSAETVIALLDLVPHPEGGHYRETFRDAGGSGARAASTAIHYLLRVGEHSHWHRVDAAEVWHFHAGAPLVLRLWRDGWDAVATHVLGVDLGAGQRPQVVVPAGTWQAARHAAQAAPEAWTLVGCTVAPAFEFAGFEMAPPGWAPPLDT
ncbi:cupin domain-containing protein [Zavarzinia sp. CC-PAN008]|uniref:cupin domain-containing protein n=1 Tax=Zavarzinia sp. CC-PAN008 TaxID=3243332 RepID=UPI003F74A67B